MIDPIEDAEMWKEALNRRTNPIAVIKKKFTEEEIAQMLTMSNPVTISTPVSVEFIEIDKLKEELKAATTYIEENEVVHLKTKKNIPTVIQYQGRRYVLDDRN